VSREYLGDLGVYARAGRVESLAVAIRSLLDDPARRADLGVALRERVAERYTWEQAGRKIMEIYRRICFR